MSSIQSPGDFQIRKKHYSAFNSTRLDAVLRELDVRRLYITGAWTEACVQHTVIDAFYFNYEISSFAMRCHPPAIATRMNTRRTICANITCQDHHQRSGD